MDVERMAWFLKELKAHKTEYDVVRSEFIFIPFNRYLQEATEK